MRPTNQQTNQQTYQPSSQPTNQLNNQPANQPTSQQTDKLRLANPTRGLARTMKEIEYKKLEHKGRVQKKNNNWINPSLLAGWGQPGSEIQPKKKLFSKKIQR